MREFVVFIEPLFLNSVYYFSAAVLIYSGNVQGRTQNLKEQNICSFAVVPPVSCLSDQFFCVLTGGFSRKNRLLSVNLQGDLSNKDKVCLLLRADDRYMVAYRYHSKFAKDFTKKLFN